MGKANSIESSVTSTRCSGATVALFAIAWLGFIVYGSLTPFEFKPVGNGGVGRWAVDAITSVRWDHQTPHDISSLGHSNAVNDLLVNFALYAPLGMLFRLAFWRRGWTWAWQCGLALSAVAIASLGIECVQGMTAERVASLKDVCVNLIGGAVGVLSAVQLRRAAIWVVFTTYRRVSLTLHHSSTMVAWARRHPLALIGALLLNVLLVWFVCYAAVPAAHRGPAGVNWIPFAREFQRSYDVAALQIGKAMAVYAAVSAVLALQFLSLTRRRSAGLVLIVAAVAGTAHQLARYMQTGDADVTGPVIAVITACATVTLVSLLVAAVRAACRRRSALPVEVERRRVPYRYTSPRAVE